MAMMDMTPTEFRDTIAQLGLSQQRAGKWLGVSKRQVQRYAYGERTIPLSFTKLLRLMLKLGLRPDEV
jgi:predicted transcriptional regulator